ncbi:hypothetical protein Hanom_Chr09g00764371 [Helianthus anomalus]
MINSGGSSCLFFFFSPFSLHGLCWRFVKSDSYSNSRYVLDHIIDIQKKKEDVACIGYKKCPSPARHNYTAMLDEENKPHFEPSVPLNLEEITSGLGFKKEVSSYSDESADAKVSSAEQNQDPTVISDVVTEEEDIPLENHILCDPPAKPAKTVLVESISTQDSETVNLLYTLDGDDKFYSNKDVSIKNVNQPLINIIFEDSTSKFFGESS